MRKRHRPAHSFLLDRICAGGYPNGMFYLVVETGRREYEGKELDQFYLGISGDARAKTRGHRTCRLLLRLSVERIA